MRWAVWRGQLRTHRKEAAGNDNGWMDVEDRGNRRSLNKTHFKHATLWRRSEYEKVAISPLLALTISQPSPQSCFPVTIIQATALPPPPPWQPPSITYTHNQYRRSAVIDPAVVCTSCWAQAVPPPGIKNPEKDTWSLAPGSPQPSSCMRNEAWQRAPTSKSVGLYT